MRSLLKKLTPLHLYQYVLAKLSIILNRIFEINCRNKIREKDFSIICYNCIGGTIYHRLGMKFLSPTINMCFNSSEFPKFLHNMQYYLHQDLKFLSSDAGFPVAKLGDLTLRFNHSKTETEAYNSWNRRKGRINFSNLFIIVYDLGISKEDIVSLAQIPCKRLVVLSENRYDDIPYVKTIKRSKKSRPNDAVFLDKDIFGFRTFEKQFDFTAWLNGKSKY